MKDIKKKWLYSFTCESEVDGKVVKKEYALLKPNRSMKESGEIFYSSEVSRFAKAGVLPRAAWSTILSNSGGSISESEREEYGKMIIDFRDKSLEVQRLITKGSGSLTAEETESLSRLSLELEGIKNSIQAFESDQANIFENTAEAKARNKAIMWWTLFIAYEKTEAGDYKEVIPGASYTEKLDAYDTLEEESSDKFKLEALSRIVYFVALWFLGRASTEEEFKIFDKQLKSGNADMSKDDSEIINSDTSHKKTDEDEGFIPEKLGE